MIRSLSSELQRSIQKFTAKWPFPGVTSAGSLLVLSLVFPLEAISQTSPYVQDDIASALINTPCVIPVAQNDSGDWVSSSFTQADNGTVTDGPGTGTLVYTPNTDFLGSDTFTYSVTDSSGPTFTATVTVTVGSISEARDDSTLTQRNTPVTVNTLSNDIGNWVSGRLSQPLHGTATGLGNGIIRYTPKKDFLGFDKFTYSVIDANGLNFTATVTVTVLRADAPDIQDDSAITRPNKPVTVDVLANDTGDWVAGAITQPSSGTVVGPGNGTATYTPNIDFVGTDTFTYSLTDSGGATLTATAIIEVNQAPIAFDDFASTKVGVPITIPALVNDNIVAAIGYASATFTRPGSGTVAKRGDVFVYTPNPGFSGFDRFTYTLTGHDGNTSTAKVSIGVNSVVFTDTTAAAGIDYVQCVAPCTGPPSPMTGGAAAGDFDNDGDVDLYVTRMDDADILYSNNGDGTFDDVTTASGISRIMGSNGAAWGDIDSDGDLDLYVTSTNDTRFYLFINNGAGVFTEEAIARGASIEGADVHDGFGVSFGDYDKDGFLDIHTNEWRKDAKNPTMALSNSRLLRNIGSSNPGYFEDVTQTAGVALDGVVGILSDGTIPLGTFAFTSKFTDLDNDGWPDLAIAADAKESRLFWNNGDGTFTDGTEAAGVAGDENGMGSAVGDVNGDGLLDWFVSSIYDPDANCANLTGGVGTTGNRLYLNNGDRSFTDVTTSAGVRDGGWGWGSTFIDYDNDGDQDLVHTNGWSRETTNNYCWWEDQVRLFDNDGSGIFKEKALTAGLFDTGSGKGLLKFDYDNDGDLDVFIVNTFGRPVLYRNDGGSDNGWLRVKFETSEQYIGARIYVKLRPSDKGKLREVNNNSNFLGQDEVTAHFGLGRGRRPVQRVTIVMPSGAIKIFSEVPRNSVLIVTDE